MTKEGTCQSTSGDAPAGTSGSNDKTASIEPEKRSVPSAEEGPVEKSATAPFDSTATTGRVFRPESSGEEGSLRFFDSTQSQEELLGLPTDKKQTRWEKFKAFISGRRVQKVNPLLLNPQAKILGTFTLWNNGHIEKGVAVMDNPNARAFQVLAVQYSRNVFRASAQPISKKKPKWWGPFYVQLIIKFMKDQERIFMEANERRIAAKDMELKLLSQNPQQVKKGS